MAAQRNRALKKAERKWAAGDLQTAFGLFLECARAGVKPAYFIVANFYDFGEGTPRDENEALYWYHRAHRDSASRSAANNIACIYREQQELKKALWWFHRAVRLGDADARIELAKLYLRLGDRRHVARKHLEAGLASANVTVGTKLEASRLLRKLGRVAKR